MKLSEIIERVIEQAKAIDAASKARSKTVPRRGPAICLADVPSFPPLPETEALFDYVVGLPVATIYMLMVLMYVGRGDYDPEDIPDAYFEMSDRPRTSEIAVKHMVGKGVLHIYFANALERLKVAKIDVDRLLERAALRSRPAGTLRPGEPHSVSLPIACTTAE